jgi:hypothetical protein
VGGRRRLTLAVGHKTRGISMAKKGENWKEEYEDIKNELLMEQVNDAIKKDPNNWRNNLEELGFTWIDDNDSQEEIEEEEKAVPTNDNQEYLVAYFEEKITFNDKMIEVFIDEVESEEPNYPLFRKYFNAGNNRLLHLLISGLSGLPTNQVLLSGLSYFHENRNILTSIISAYANACNKENNTGKFKELCINYISDTHSDGYEALVELESMFNNDHNKRIILEEIKQTIHKQDEVIAF